MSFFDDALTALIKPSRQFGNMIAQIVISEDHEDSCEVTQHPVELGASITDHVVLLPTKLVITMGWTDYGLQSVSTYVNEAINSAPVPSPQSIANIYKTILFMRFARIPFTIVTGKRKLENMVIRSIKEETNNRTENALILRVYCEQIIMVQTTYVSIPPNAVHANPAASANPVSVGTQQSFAPTVPANMSFPP